MSTTLLLLSAAPAHLAVASPANPIQMIYNLGRAAFFVLDVARWGVAAIAIAWAIKALMNMYAVSSATGGQPNKLFTSRSQPTMGSAFMQLIFAALLFSTAYDLTPMVVTSSMVEGANPSIQGYNDYAEYQNSLFQYDDVSEPPLDQSREIIKSFILMLMRVVGFVAVCRGFKILYDNSNGDGQKTDNQGFGFIFFGTLAFNFWWTYSLVANTLGFDVLSLIN